MKKSKALCCSRVRSVVQAGWFLKLDHARPAFRCLVCGATFTSGRTGGRYADCVEGREPTANGEVRYVR